MTSISKYIDPKQYINIAFEKNYYASYIHNIKPNKHPQLHVDKIIDNLIITGGG